MRCRVAKIYLFVRRRRRGEPSDDAEKPFESAATLLSHFQSIMNEQNDDDHSRQTGGENDNP